MGGVGVPIGGLEMGSSMPFCSNLHSAVVHNVAVALNMAGLLHADLTLAQRCEASVSFFILMDVVQILAAAKAQKLRMPVGSCQMAQQTITNLQSCSLAAIMFCLSQEPTFQPFDHGFARMSELPIEHWFGMIRVQSTNAQHSARSYWQSVGRQQLKHGKLLLNAKTPRPSSEKPLNDTVLPGRSLFLIFCFFFCAFTFSIYHFVVLWCAMVWQVIQSRSRWSQIIPHHPFPGKIMDDYGRLSSGFFEVNHFVVPRVIPVEFFVTKCDA